MLRRLLVDPHKVQRFMESFLNRLQESEWERKAPNLIMDKLQTPNPEKPASTVTRNPKSMYHQVSSAIGFPLASASPLASANLSFFMVLPGSISISVARLAGVM